LSGDRGYGGRANSEVSVDTVRDHALARLGNPRATEAHSHAPPQRLGVEQSIRQRMCDEEPADFSR
jgi:hypothetical protein